MRFTFITVSNTLPITLGRYPDYRDNIVNAVWQTSVRVND